MFRLGKVQSQLIPVPLSQSIRNYASQEKQCLVALICHPDSPALAYLPRLPNVEFIVGNDMKTFNQSSKLHKIDNIVYVAGGGSAQLLSPLFDACPNVTWVSSFSSLAL
jgi:hypothetical protein